MGESIQPKHAGIDDFYDDARGNDVIRLFVVSAPAAFFYCAGVSFIFSYMFVTSNLI
jgi:hypothetical protein